MFLTNQIDGRYTCITADCIICSNSTRNEAYQAAIQRFPFLSAPQIESALDRQADPALWRANFSSATGHSIKDLESSVATLEDDSEVDELKAKLLDLAAAIESETQRIAGMENKQKAQIQQSQLLRDKKQLLHKCKRRRLQLKMEFIKKNGYMNYPRSENVNGRWYMVNDVGIHFDLSFSYSPLAKQISQLENEVGGL